MKKYMEDPLVRQAVDHLHRTLALVAGKEVKNLLIIGLIPDQPGSGTAKACTTYKGCTCSDCAQAVLIAASRTFGAEFEVEIVDPPTGVAAAREVH